MLVFLIENTYVR